MRISDWSSDVCSSDLLFNALTAFVIAKSANAEQARGIMFWLLGNLSGVRWADVWMAVSAAVGGCLTCFWHIRALDAFTFGIDSAASLGIAVRRGQVLLIGARSEEHTSELQSLMRTQYAVFCLQKKKY